MHLLNENELTPADNMRFHIGICQFLLHYRHLMPDLKLIAAWKTHFNLKSLKVNLHLFV